MLASNLNQIINEEINNTLNKKLISEESNNSFLKMIKKYFEDFPHRQKKNSKDKKNKKKVRKGTKGRKDYYDYEDYERKNVKVSLGDANSIRNSIDTEKTNMAAIARELFPDHTDEGAQSQLRKILNGERPMTKQLASKLSKYISRGKIAVK